MGSTIETAYRVIDLSLWPDVAPLLDKALDLEGDALDSLLDSVNDAEIRSELRRYLRYARIEGTTTLGGLLSRRPLTDLPEGARIGPYTIRHLLGSGGAGVVYEAVDVRANKPVALKVMTSEDAPELSEHVEREVRLLGRLEHPNIARYLGAGEATVETERGEATPILWIAMELVEGEPVTAFAEREGLTTTERAKLLVQACEAVQHALGRAVLHRDLKPSNVMATRDDAGRPTVKVVDFGVGRLLDETGEGRAPSTSFQLTPAYAAPEQFNGQASTSATDVWGLGMVGRDLLSNLPPRNDLSAILRKACAEEPSDRYESAGELRADLQRYLDRRPVTARGPAPLYTATRFLHRRWPWVLGAMAFLTLGSLALLYTVEARIRAEEARSSRAAMAALYAQVFEGGDVWQTGDVDPALADYLSAVASRVDQLRLKPHDEADLRGMLGRTAMTLALYDLADEQLETARSLVTDDPARRARLLVDVAALRTRQGEYDAADSLSSLASTLFGQSDERFLALQQRGVALGYLGHATAADSLYALALPLCHRAHNADHPECTELVLNRAAAAAMLSEYELADSLYGRALGLLRGRYRETAPLLWQAEANHANVISNLGRYDEAIQTLQRVRRIGSSQLGESHPEVEKVTNDLAGTWLKAGRADLAAELFAAALERRREELGPDHPDVAFSENNLAVAYARLGQYQDALPLYRDVLRILLQVVGPDHPNVAVLRDNVGASLRELGRFEEADAELSRALTLRRSLFGEDHVQTAASLYNLGMLDARRGRYDDAIHRLQRSLSIRERELGEDHPLVASTHLELADALSSLGNRRREAVRHASIAVQIREAATPTSEAGIAHAEAILGLANGEAGWEDARRAIARLERAVGAAHPLVRRLRSRVQ